MIEINPILKALYNHNPNWNYYHFAKKNPPFTEYIVAERLIGERCYRVCMPIGVAHSAADEKFLTRYLLFHLKRQMSRFGHIEWHPNGCAGGIKNGD